MEDMSRRPVHLVLSAAAWLGFQATVVWTMAFLADVVIPRTVDGPARMATPGAIAIDVALLCSSASSTRSWRAARSRRGWAGAYRHRSSARRTCWPPTPASCCCWCSGSPGVATIWHVHGAAASALWAVCGVGWTLAIASTYAVDHFELVGLRQAGWVEPGDDTSRRSRSEDCTPSSGTR